MCPCVLMCTDVDPVVFLTLGSEQGMPPLEPGQIRRCLVTGASLYDLEAAPVC